MFYRKAANLFTILYTNHLMKKNYSPFKLVNSMKLIQQLGRGNRSEEDHWGDLGVDGCIILGWISRRWDVGIWTGLGWPRIETGG